ncbi:MAG: hypothetical protein HYU66_25780 [Armatimonadetes bacterium]|nr:hypothetical protein [Armatimonadota bacterium]
MSDTLMRARAERMQPHITAGVTEVVDDARLNELVDELQLFGRGLHGRFADVPMVVVLNRFLFDHDEATQAARRDRYPNLFRSPYHKLTGYGLSGKGCYEWRDSGSPEYRARTGMVCQPAWQIHTIVGCPFRCAYCGLGWTQHLLMNLEKLVERLDGWIGDDPPQTLWQHDNHSDVSEFEPEYGSSALLIDYFAHKPGCYLELYVGKSDNVDNLLSLDHRGKTTCCWSVSLRSQCDLLEPGTASLTARLESIRKCQEAGYPVRIRYSPLIPIRGWREELREMIELTFATCRPELITFETLRYMSHDAIVAAMRPEVLDPEWLELMREAPAKPEFGGGEIPDAFRERVYRAVIDDLEEISPRTPYAFCRESRPMWDCFATDFERHWQRPDSYVCNCGPFSSPDHALLQVAGG